MTLKVLIAGFGGQGILFIGQLLARAAMKQELNVSWVPSYGVEMRGGTAHCSVIISAKEISSPLVENPDILLAFNQPSLDKFEPLLPENGILIANKSLVKQTDSRDNIRQYSLPANQLAEELGNVKAVNMVMLGALLAATDLINPNTVIEELREVFDNSTLLALNQKALDFGYHHLTEYLVL